MAVVAGRVHVHPRATGRTKVDSGSLKIGGVAVDRAASYRVVLNNFIADGGDGFSVFKSCTNPLGGDVDIDAFARYLEAELASEPAAAEPDHPARLRPAPCGGGYGRPHTLPSR